MHQIAYWSDNRGELSGQTSNPPDTKPGNTQRTVVQYIKQQFNEHDHRHHVLRINSTLFDQKDKYKVTWHKWSGQTSTLDYLIVNQDIDTINILHIRTVNLASKESDLKRVDI